jgi:hypothetical protein
MEQMRTNLNEYWPLQGPIPDHVPEWAREAFENIVPYVRDFLCAKHPKREGKVCPFVPAAIRNQRLLFTSASPSQDHFEHKTRIRKAVDYYLSTKRKPTSFGSIIILFPDDFDIGTLLQLHFENKEYCIRNFLMLGALYETNMAPSLHGETFFPLRTPSPTLVIRDLVPSDIQFLDPQHYSERMRLLFLNIFVTRFGGIENQRERNEVSRAIELIRYYETRARLRTMVLALLAITVIVALLLLVGISFS